MYSLERLSGSLAYTFFPDYIHSPVWLSLSNLRLDSRPVLRVHYFEVEVVPWK